MMDETTDQSAPSVLEFNTVELPPSIEIKESSIRAGEAGAFAKELIAKDTRFGPYKGEIINAGVRKYIDYRFAWEVLEKRSHILRHTVCAMDTKLSNWMRHVNCARFYEEQNILSVQDGFSIFYVAMKDIKPGEELLTWFDPKLLKRTKRRLSKMVRRPVGYTIELVPWTDEKKFVPEIIETKRARKKKVLSDMISLDENPMAITRTLQSLPKVPCTPRQLAQSATYRHLFASLIEKAESSPKPDSRRSASRDKSGKKQKIDPVVIHSQHNKLKTKTNKGETQRSDSSSAWKDVKNIVSASCMNKMANTIKTEILTNTHTTDEKVLKRGRPLLEGNSSICPKPRKPRRRTKNNSILAMNELTALKPIVFKSNDDGSMSVEDHDESFLLKDMEFRAECDEDCPCLDKKEATKSHDLGRRDKESFVIYFTLLPEHKTLSPNNKVMYKCDICGSAYNHAYSLKRHYLGIHINHRYLTPSDIQSCQIKTFHVDTQLQICSPRYPTPIADDKDRNEADIKNISDNAINDNTETCELKSLSIIPSLAQLAKIVIEKISTISNAPIVTTELDKKRLVLTSLDSNAETLDKTGLDRHELIMNSEKVQSTVDVQASEDVSDLNSGELCSHSKTEMSDSSKMCLQADKMCATLEDRDLSCVESSPSLSEECTANNMSYTCVITESSKTSHLTEGHSVGLIDKVSSAICRVAKVDDDSEQITVAGKVIEASSNTETQDNASEVDAVSLSSCSDNHLTLNSDESTKLFSETSLPHNVLCNSDISNLQPSNFLDTSTEMSSVLESVCEHNSLSSTDNVTSQLLTNSEDVNKPNCPAPETENLHCSLKELDIVNAENTASERSMETLLSNSELIESDSICNVQPSKTSVLSNTSDSKILSLPAIISSDIPLSVDPLQSLTFSAHSETVAYAGVKSSTPLAINEPVSCSDVNSSASLALSGSVACTETISLTPISSKAESVVTPSSTLISSLASSTSVNSIAVAVSAKNSSPLTPQVIFVTNIVFPIVTTSHKALTTSAQSSTSSAQAVTTACLAKTLTKGNQSTGVPLVLISPITGGISGANAFLQSSKALKTIQTLQNSLNARSLSKAPTIITGTKGSAPTMCTGVSTVAGNLESCINQATVAVHMKSPVQPPVTSSTLPSSLSSPSVTPVIGQENGSDQPEDLYRCHMCVLLFKTMSQLKNHIKNDPHRFKGGIKQYACSHCSVRFSNKANLMRHNLIRHNLINHQEEGNHKHICYTCGKGFSTETYLNMHARFHSGKNFPCKYGCEDLVFPNAATLVKHLRTQHAGLDLKEYLKNVKPRDRKKRNRVKKTSDPVGVVQVTGITSEYQSPAPYSMMQPGIGFQAKRTKLKLSRETVANEIKTEAITDDEKSNDSKLEEMKCEENNAPETLLFKCKLCLKGFSTHLRLLQHRTLKHGTSQSVQEYLYQMSKDVYDDEYSEQDSSKLEDISPPSSPKTFFSNVNRKGYENMKHYIDGGLESLKNWRKYLKVEDYVSLAEPTLCTDTTDCKMEWTYYNFPPTFVYKSDCTEFYNEEFQEIKSETGADKLHQNDNSDAPEENQAVFPMDERKTEQSTVIKPEAEDVSYGAVSQERGYDIITRLEQRLLADQDNSEISDKKKALDDNDTHISVKIKTEVEDSSYDETSLNKTCKHSNTHEDCEILDSPYFSDKPSEFAVSDSIQDISMQVTSMNSIDSAEKKDTLCRLDSGFSSLSSSESPSLDLYENDAKVLDTNSSEISSAGHDEDKLQNFMPEKSCVDISSVPVLHTSTPSKREFKRHILPDFPLQEKLEALESSHIQSINLEANHSHCVKSELSASRLIDSLNLHVTGSQLLSTKIMHILEKYRSSDLCPAKGNRRQRTLSLPSLGLVSSSKRVHHAFAMDGSLNMSDSSRHDHKRYSIWTGQIHQKVLKEAGESTFCCPVVETVKKQESIRLREQYMYEKASRDRENDGKQIKKKSDQEKVEFARVMGLMQRKEFEISHHAKKLEEHIIKPPEIWKNYENIWFGKKGTIAVVCSICHRHFSYWDLCLRHQLKKHPHIEPASIEMERNNDVEDLYYYYPMRYGILAQTQLIPDNLPPIEVYVCTRCGFPFKNLNRLHSHIIDCDPAREASSKARILGKSSHTKKKLLPIMDRRLTQEPEPMPSRNRHGKNLKISSNTCDRNKRSVLTLTPSQVAKSMQKISCPPKQANVKNSPTFFSHNSVDAGSKQKSYDLLYNPQNHMRRRELYKVLDQHQCHGCNLKFNSLSMLERHVNKCIGREKLQSQKPLVSQIIPDDAAVRKQHTCRYCSKRFTFIKGVDLHYKRICAVRKVKEEENQLTEEDLAHEEELKRIIEHMKWSKALNKDSSDIIQGHVRVEEDGTLTRVVKERSCPKGARKKKALNLSKQIQNEEDMSLSSSASSSSQNLSSNNTQIVEDATPSEKPCRRLTRSTSLEKVSPVSTTGKRKLASSTSDMSLKKKTRSNSSRRVRNDNRRKSECNANRSRKQSVTPRSRNTSVNKVQNGKLQKTVSESSLSRASVNESVRLPARKRGRPQKFDPSDLESSYKKKKKLEMFQKQTKAEMSKTDCPKTKSNSAIKTKAEMTSNKKTANSESSNRNQRQSSSTPSNKTVLRELTSAESSKMMEKMKQLKEAAKLESDIETKLKRAKQAKKVNAKKCSDQDLMLNSDSQLKKSPGRTQSSELFKQLTKSETKVTLVKPSLPNPSPKMSDKKMLTSNSTNVSTLTYSKRKNSEIPQGASPPKKINTTVHSSSPKKLNSNSPSPSQSASTTGKTGLKNSPAAASEMITLAKTKVTETNPSAVVDKISPKSVPVKISTLPTKLTASVAGSSVESAAVPTSKAQPVCVRVVTLSPNGMNLLTFDSPADVPTKVVSPCTPVTKSPEVSTILSKKIVKTSSLETLQLVCSASVSQPDTKPLEGNKLLNTTISIPTHNIPSSSVNTCIKIKKPLNQVVVKTAEEISVKNKNTTSDHQLSAANSVSQKGGQSHFVISQMESSPVTTTLYTVAKPQGYSVLKTAPVVHNLSTEGVKTILTAPGSKLAGNQIVLNNPRQKFVKLTSPVQKVKFLGNSDIKVSDVMKEGQVSKVGDTVRLISSTKLLSPTNVVPSSGSDAKHIVLGSTPTILVSPSPTKSSLSSSTAPGIAIGTKLRTPASRFASPQSNVIHGNVFTPGTRVLKIGSTVTSTALHVPSADIVSAPRIKGTAPTKIISTIPEKHVLTVSVPKTSVSGTQPRLSQAIPSTPKQIIKLNTNNFASRSQPTVIIQSSPSAQSIHRQSQGSSILKTLTPTTVTTVRTPQASIPNPKKVVATGISAPKQPTVISQPSSLLSNQIMISLDDGTTAMLDPDSLAQLLSMSPTLNTQTDLDSEILSTIETDPEHVMVNMAEIQPAHQQQTDDISWPANGCVDLTDFSNSICDL
ncbi:PR domain zinc finger protein 2 [Biomphalaria glabrata]|nr:PR domain zinc finger protein 2 [Biomphalaria glabrata]